MEIFASVVLALMGSLLIATAINAFTERNNRPFGNRILLFAVLLTISYYLSLAIIIL